MLQEFLQQVTSKQIQEQEEVAVIVLEGVRIFPQEEVDMVSPYVMIFANSI
jgi:hypothetical protein